MWISLKNCRVYVTLFPCNECAKAIIQSGIRELVYLSDKYADAMSTIASKKMLDAAGLTDCGIILSSDLDEYVIRSIREQGAQVTGWGVGTKLACAFDQPSLGGVYKLAATREPGEDTWRDHVKVSESSTKLTIPGLLDVRRYYYEDGKIAGDMIFDTVGPAPVSDTIIDPMDSLRRKSLANLRYETLLQPLARAGEVVLPAEAADAMAARARAFAGLETLDESQKRQVNPHTYPVGLETQLQERRRALVARLRGYE